jgi:hypothetical protein
MRYDAYPEAIADREKMEELTGQKIHPDAFQIIPQGSRVHVVLEEVPEEYMGVLLTEESRSREPVGVGWILAAGEGVMDPGPYPGGISGKPEALIYKHVIFSATMGMPIRFNLTDRDFKSQVVVMETRAIRGVDSNPKSHIQRLKERE